MARHKIGVEHTTEGRPAYRGYCSCEWRGQWHILGVAGTDTQCEQNAANDAVQHEEEMYG